MEMINRRATFHINLRYLRKNRGLKVQYISDQTKIPKRTFDNYLQGSRYPDPAYMDALVNFFNVSEDDLNGPPNPNIGKDIIRHKPMTVNRSDEPKWDVKFSELEERLVKAVEDKLTPPRPKVSRELEDSRELIFLLLDQLTGPECCAIIDGVKSMIVNRSGQGALSKLMEQYPSLNIPGEKQVKA